jgi:hypothetical protein
LHIINYNFIIQALKTTTSLVLSSLLVVILSALMQIFKNNLSSNQYFILFGGFLGSLLFTSILGGGFPRLSR